MEQRISIERLEDAASLFGALDENIRMLEREFDVTITSRDGLLKISGEESQVPAAVQAVNGLLTLCARGEEMSEQLIRYVFSLVRGGRPEEIESFGRDVLCITSRGKPIRAKTSGQTRYIKAIQNNTITLGVGPAGTGKTYLAVAAAVAAFRAKEVNRIILTRPAVEAGERLGFLPGDLQSKVDPYLRPLYDALYEIMGVESYQRMAERGTLEVAPLAFMRGRTLGDAFIILDEAQNTTPEQMKMFLTRLGASSRCIVTGDVSQIDLPKGRRSGLVEAMEVLRDVEGISVVELTARDVVRHELVQKIVRAYEAYEAKEGDGV